MESLTWKTTRHVLCLLCLIVGGCGKEDPIAPSGPPAVTFHHFTTLPGELPQSNKHDAWSPVGRRLAYQSWNGSGWDLQVYDAEQPSNPPLLLHSGDASRIVSWSPDGRWLLCVMQDDILSGLYSLVAFPVTVGAPPHVLVASRKISWATWGANGKIYYWDRETGERLRLDPPAEGSALSAGPYADRPSIIPLSGDGPYFSIHWLRTLPEEEEGVFDYRNPGQKVDIQSLLDAFPEGRRFLALVPIFCGPSAVVDEHGKMITELWSVCRDLYLEFYAVSSDGRFLVGMKMYEVNDWLMNSFPYLGDADGNWRVPIDGAPEGRAPALSRVGYTLAYERIPGDSIYVGNLEVH